jgi:hypothetical protein
MDAFFETHQSLMRETHHLEGAVEPVILSYSVLNTTKCRHHKVHEI